MTGAIRQFIAISVSCAAAVTDMPRTAIADVTWAAIPIAS